MSDRFGLKSILTTALAAATMTLWGAEPSGYYNSCEGKSGAALLQALGDKVGNHTVVSYDGLWELYKTSDVKANGKLWDMYSTKEWTPGQNKCGNYKNVGDCVNREHSFPKSWFNDAKPMYSDAFHLYPTDGKVNGQRSNNPYGECAGGTTLPSSGNVKALGRLGKSTFSGYSGTVFEPVDEYKGDFARSYFYMAAAYNDKISGWSSPMLAGNRYPAFSSWAVNLLLKWHRQDPVSQKELDRNEAVYARQKNRNPFIDHPELAEYVWGDRKTSSWSLNASSDPEFTLPAAGTVIDLGTCGVGVARTKTVTVKGLALTAMVGVSVQGAGFSVSPSSLSAASVCSADGATVTVTYRGTSAGSATGTLLVQSGTLKSATTLRATAVEGLPATAPTSVSDVSFVAHWTYIGDADANGCYTIHVLDASGAELDTYPRSVRAADEEFLVDELEPTTTYTYYITTASGVRSNDITVSTHEPIPSIQLLYDGDLEIYAAPGEPSDAYEIVLDVENIAADIVLSVTAPFELSSDKGTWGQQLTVDPAEDRFYLRVNSAEAGTFSTTLRAASGDYVNDETDITATVMESVTFNETFESETPGGSGYNTNGATLTGVTGDWNVYQAGIYSSSSEAHDGKKYMRTSKNTDSYFDTAAAKNGGVGTVTFWASAWAAGEAGDVDIQTSDDDGATWTTAGTVTVSGAKSYTRHTVTVNRAGAQRVRFQQKTGQRLMFDDIEITDYHQGAGIDGVESDYRSWTAYCRGGELVVELATDSQVRVYGVDGIVYHNGMMGAGQTALSLPAGLYVVAVDDFARRVLVKD